MTKFLTIAFVIVAASMFVSCSGKNLDDLIEVPDTDDTTDSSSTSDQNDTGDSAADTGDISADTGDSAADTGDTSADTGDSTADTGDSDNDGDNSDSDDADSSDSSSDDDADSSDSDSDDDADSSDSSSDDDADSSDSDSDDDADSSDSSSDDDADSSDSDSDDDADSSDSNGDDDTDTGDSGENQQRCTEITLNEELSYKKESSTSHVFKTTYTPNTGSNDNLYIKVFGPYTNSYAYKYPLAETNWNNDDGYRNGVFVYIYEDESHSKMYFQRKGHVDVSLIRVNSGIDTLYADLIGVELEEVTINGANTSTPVQGGKCLKITDTPVHYQWY